MAGFVFIKQHDAMQCGAACLVMLCHLYGKKYSLQQISKSLESSKGGVSMYDISELAKNRMVVSLKVCNSSFLSLYFHCYFILFFPVFELIYSPFICCLCFLHRHGCQEEDDGLL